MNKKRRERIEEAKSILQECLDEEQEYFDNMPENLQDGEKGTVASNAIDSLEEAINALEYLE